MRVLKLTTRNFRSYPGKETVSLASPINVFIGPNNSGKSNTLEALRLLRGLAARQSTRPWAELAHAQHQTEPIEIQLEFEPTANERESALSTLRGTPIPASGLAKRIIWRIELDVPLGVKTETLSIHAPDGQWLDVFKAVRTTSEGRGQWTANVAKIEQHVTSNPGKWGPFEMQPAGGFSGGYTPLSEISGDLAAHRVHKLVRDFVASWVWFAPIREAKFDIQAGQTTRVKENGQDVIQVLNYYQTRRVADYAKMTQELANIIPELTRIIAPPKDAGIVTAFAEETGGVELPIENFGSGLQQVLILIMQMMTTPGSTVMLVEEPEIHLHAASQRQLLEFMIRLAKERGHQFLLTTHSTVFAPVRHGVAVTLVSKKDGVSTRHPLTDKAGLKQLTRALGHDNTDLYGYRGVLIVEGETEQVAIPILLDDLGIDFDALGIRIANIRGAQKMKHLEELLRFLKDTNVEAFVLLDRNRDAENKAAAWKEAGLLSDANLHVWEGDFEDCFPDDVLLDALKSLAKHYGARVDATKEDLTALRKKRSSAAKAVSELYRHATGHDLSKPEFGEELANAVIRKAPRKVVTKPQEVLQAIAGRFVKVPPAVPAVQAARVPATVE